LVRIAILFPKHAGRCFLPKPLTDGRPKLVPDLNDTLYPASCPLGNSLINANHDFIMQFTDPNMEKAIEPGRNYYHIHGSTGIDLRNLYGVPTSEFKDFLNRQADYSHLYCDDQLGDILFSVDAEIGNC
jgi:hypothetical protein